MDTELVISCIEDADDTAVQAAAAAYGASAVDWVSGWHRHRAPVSVNR